LIDQCWCRISRLLCQLVRRERKAWEIGVCVVTQNVRNGWKIDARGIANDELTLRGRTLFLRSLAPSTLSKSGFEKGSPSERALKAELTFAGLGDEVEAVPSRNFLSGADCYTV
jgi:hypothetical protein